MNVGKKPIDWSIIQKIDNHFFRGKNTISVLLRYLDIKYIIDVNCFLKNNGYEPDISSIFSLDGVGSYDFDTPQYGYIYIHNGTLAVVENIPISISMISDYYKEQFNMKSNLQTQTDIKLTTKTQNILDDILSKYNIKK